MRKVADEKPVVKPAKPVTASSIGLANPEFQIGLEPLHLLSPSDFIQSVPDEVSGLSESIWQPVIQATLEQVGQTLLDWCWKAFEKRFAEQLKTVQSARALSSQLLDPQLSLHAKCTALLNELETSKVTGATITPYLDIARQLNTILKGLQQPGSGIVKRGIDTLNNLMALLDLPAAQQIAGKGTLSPVRDLLRGALVWAQTLQRLSNVSWDSPQAIVDGLLQSGALSTWVTEIVEQGQKLYKTLSNRLTAIKHKGEQLQRLHGLLEQFNQANDIKAKFTALLTLLLDENMLGLIEKYAPAAMGDGLKAFALFKNALQDGGEKDTTGLRTTLLSIEHVTSQPFIDRLSSEAGGVGQLMAEPLGNVRAALRGSASQEAAFNLLLGLTDPKKTWPDFLLESSREMLLLPQVQDLGTSFASRFAWQAQAIKALYGVLNETFWAQYKTVAWAELPALISDTALRDAQNKQSQLAIALSAASGIPGQHIQTVFTEVSRVCRSWGNDSWPEFLPKVMESVKSLLCVLVQHGQVLPIYVQTLLDIGLWAAKGITRLLMLHAVWKAKADDEVLGEATLALIRKAIEEYAGDNAAWGFDKAVIWLPMLPPLYKVLGNLEPIKEGQRVQWLSNLLMRLYSLPEAQTNKDIIWVREQIEAKAELWLGGIPAAMLGNAIVGEIQSKPGYDLTPMFTRAVQLQGLTSYISDCFANVMNALRSVDIMTGVTALLNPARAQVPGRQYPAYLRTLLILNFVLPAHHPQGPLSTTPQSNAPIAWGAGAGAAFLGGILFTYFAYKNYRKGNQTPSQPDEEMQSLKRNSDNDPKDDESPSTATEDQRLNESPYKSPSVSLKQKSSHWKKTGPLTAMAGVMFTASAYSLWKNYGALAENAADEKVKKLEALEAKARNDFNLGNTNTLSDDLTEFTETITTDQPTTERPRSARSATPSTVTDIDHYLNQHKYNNSTTTTTSKEIESPLDIPSKHTQKVKKNTLVKTQAIDALPLMIEATALLKTLTSGKSSGKTEEQLKLTHDRLAMVVVKLKTIRTDLTNVTPEQYAEHFTDRETYAYSLLAEMKAYYPAAVANIWGEFAPDAQITYTYRNRSGGPEEALAPLIDFVNGAVTRKLGSLGLLQIYGFEGPREGSEVAIFLSNDPKPSGLGDWTKKQTLNSTKFFQRAYGRDGPSMTDSVLLKVQPLKTPAARLQEITVTLDQFLKGEHTDWLGHAPDFLMLKEIQWPQHYTKAWIQNIHKAGMHDAYVKGQQVVETINTNIEEDAETQAFAASFWTDPTILADIKNHEKLRSLNKDSIITLAITHNNETISYDMSLVSFMCSEYKRFFPSSIVIKITHPFQLIPSTDLTVQGLIDQCTIARNLHRKHLVLEHTMEHLKAPTLMSILQELLTLHLVAHSPQNNLQKIINLSDTVEVVYQLNQHDFHNNSYAADKTKYTKEYKIWQIMGKAHERYKKESNFINMTVDPDKHYDPGAMRLITSKNWSAAVDNSVASYKTNSQLKSDWINTFTPLIESKRSGASAIGVNVMTFNNNQLSITPNDNFKLVGVFRVSTGEQSFELHSVFSPKVWKFNNTSEYNAALNNQPYAPPTTTPRPANQLTSATNTSPTKEQDNKELYQWLNEHLQASNQKQNTGRNQLLVAPPYNKPYNVLDARMAAQTMFDDYFERLNLDSDFYLSSDNELLFREIFQYFEFAAGLISIVALPVSGPLSFLLRTGLALVPFAKLALADSRAEFKEILVDAVLSVGLDSGLSIAGKLYPAALVGSVAKKIKDKKRITYKSPTPNSPGNTKTQGTHPAPANSNVLKSIKNIPAVLTKRIERATLHGITYDFEITTLDNGILVYSIINDAGDNMILSGHGAYKSTSKTFNAPNDMTLQFIGPHGYKLKNPTVNLMNITGGIKPHTIISPGGIVTHSPLKPGPIGAQDRHTLNTTLKHSTGSKEPGEVKDYSLGYFSEDKPSHIKVAMANNRALVKKGTPGVVKTDYVTVNPTTPPNAFTVPTVQVSEVIERLRELPHKYKTITASFCRVKSPSVQYQTYDAIGPNPRKVVITKGFEDTYDMSGNLVHRAFRIWTVPMYANTAEQPSEGATHAAATAQQENENLDQTFIMEKTYDVALADADSGTIYTIAGPFTNDEWRRKEMWESGIAFSSFEAMDTAGSINFTVLGDQLLYLSAKDPIEDNRWKLEWKINLGATQRPGTPSPSGAVPPLSGSVTGPMMDDVLKDISSLLPYIINNQNLEVSVYTSKEHMRLLKEPIIDDRIISIDADVYMNESSLIINVQSGISDASLNSIDPSFLPAYFNTYLSAMKITGHADKSIDILNFLLTQHAHFHSSSWPTPVTRIAIEQVFEDLSGSPIIAQILTDLLVKNFIAQTPPAGESQLSRAGISRFLRALMEQSYLDLNFTPDDTELNRNTMTEKFDQHIHILVDTYLLTPEFARWLTVIKYIDADIDGLLSRQQPTYAAGYKGLKWLNGARPILSFEEVGSIQTYTNSEGHPSPLSRHQRARVRIMKNDIYIYEKIYEIPMAYRQPNDMTFYIANAINLDMRHQDFDSTDQVIFDVSFAAGTLAESRDQNDSLTGYSVTVEHKNHIPILSNIDSVTNNPAVDYIAIVDFI